MPELHVRGSHYNWGGFDVESDHYATKFRSPVYDDSAFFYDYHNGVQIGGNHLLLNGTRLRPSTPVSSPITRAGWTVSPKVGLHISQSHTDWYDIPGSEG